MGNKLNRTEAQEEAKRRWGEGDHCLNIHLYCAVGKGIVTFFEDHAENYLDSYPEQYGEGRSWESAFTDYDRKTK